MPNSKMPRGPGLSVEDQLRLANAPKLPPTPSRPIDPNTTNVFQTGPDGKLHPFPGWHTTGPYDFEAWAHNVDWWGVTRDLGKILAGAVASVAPNLAPGATGLGVVGDGAATGKIAGAAAGSAGLGLGGLDDVSPRQKPKHW